jgi:hypothetical protein
MAEGLMPPQRYRFSQKFTSASPPARRERSLPACMNLDRVRCGPQMSGLCEMPLQSL